MAQAAIVQATHAMNSPPIVIPRLRSCLRYQLLDDFRKHIQNFLPRFVIAGMDAQYIDDDPGERL
jgi:hypothetical protein